MSFAQGLLAGTQAARNALDAYKDSRQQRIEREFAQGLAALDEQQKQGQAGLQDYYSGANNERFAEVPTQAPTQFNQGLMPEAVPQAPMTPEQMVQQQLALANRLGLRQEAGNYTNQLNALRQQQMEQSRYDQQMAWNEQQADTAQQRFEQERKDRLNQTSIDRNQRAAFDALNYKLAEQRQGIAQSAENRAADATKTAEDRQSAQDLGNSLARNILAGATYDPTQFAELSKSPAGVEALYAKLAENGVPTQALGSISDGVRVQLEGLLEDDYGGSEEAKLKAVTDFVQQFDPNASNQSPVEIVPVSEGVYQVQENGVVLEQGGLNDILNKLTAGLQENPIGFGVRIYGVTKQQQAAEERRVAAFNRQSKLKEEIGKDILKYQTEMHKELTAPKPGTPDYNLRMFNAYVTRGAELEDIPPMYVPLNYEEIIAAANGGGSNNKPAGTTSAVPTAEELRGKTLEEQIELINKGKAEDRAAADADKATRVQWGVDLESKLAAGETTPEQVRELVELGSLTPEQQKEAERVLTQVRQFPERYRGEEAFLGELVRRYRYSLKRGSTSKEDLRKQIESGSLSPKQVEAAEIALSLYGQQGLR